MKVKAAIKKIESTLKVPVEQVDEYFYATFGDVELRFRALGRFDYDNPESALEMSADSFHIQQVGDQSRPEYDEFPGAYVDNVAQLIRLAASMNDTIQKSKNQVKEIVEKVVRKINR